MLIGAREWCRWKGGVISRWAGVALGVILFCAPTYAATGLEYLASQQNPDGSFGNTPISLATPLQSTAEVLRAYQALGQQGQPSFTAALVFLNGGAESNTEFLARKIIVNTAANASTAPWLSALLPNQSATGGFGDNPGYDASVIDTAFALEALAIANAVTSPQTAGAVGYLLGQQQSNGGWADGDNEPSVYLTALVMRALWYHRFTYGGVTSALTNGQNFLLARRDSGGLWGEHFNTALALIALIPVVSDLAVLNNSVTALQAAQLPNGSWSDDPYTTALALRAINDAGQPRADPDLGAVTGRVIDNVTGAPIANAAITAMGASTQSATSDADGRYLISHVVPGPVNLSASAPGFLTANATGAVLASGVLDFSPRLIKDTTPVPITIQGSVMRSDTGAPLAGAAVRVVNTTLSIQTQTDGRFVLAGIPPGSIRVEIALAGFSSSAFAVSAGSGGSVDFGIVALMPGSPTGTTGTVQGTVVDALTDQPLRNVVVSISGADNKTAVSDVGGHFTISDVTPGNIALAANLDGYLTASGSGTLTAGSSLNFNARLIKQGDPARTTLTGRVVDSNTGSPLSGVVVAVSPSFLTGSISDGTFLVSDIPAGTLTITLSLPGYVGVAYTAAAPAGGTVALGTIALSPDVPISGNRNPVITSRGPTSAVAGQVYAYNVLATDADGDALTFALSNNPSGMTISATGQVRWVPTVDQAGARTFTVVVLDTQGGRAQEAVNLNVATGGSRSYVVTDVQTLSGLYVDAIVPDNYRIGTYISGGSPGFVSGSPPCPLTWFSAGSNIAGALSQLERLTGPNSLGAQPASGRDLILDMGQAYTSVTVFPQIDHGPFPQEGIEYTVWGSDDPNAAFPSGWRLASLVSIYRKGYVVTPSCGGQDETDDYAGLYTFGLNSYRYVRVRADFSITIFNTPAHTTWEGAGDDGGEPGWQSSEAEIDAVGGMVCDVKPQASAGTDIIGLTGQTIRFDGSASQGNIRTYGWDLDGDGVIDMTGANPTRVFANEFDRDVTLMVVDDRGCVGTDTVRVTVDLNLPRPDLTVNQVDTSNVVTDAQTLGVTGNARVVVQNVGRAAALTPALVTLFEDSNRNGVFDKDIDNVLGSMTMPSGLARGASLSMNIAVNGTASFRDNAIYAMVDSDQRVVEEREDNNVRASASACSVPAVARTFQPQLKWAWTGSAVLPQHKQVMSAPVVAALEDTNGDGKIDQNDIPAVVFQTFAGGNYEADGVLRAVSGRDGHELWTVTDPAYRTNGTGSIAVADLDGNGSVEIIVPKNGGGIIAFDRQGKFLWSSSAVTVRWGGAAISDLDADGRAEIIIGNTALNADGTLRWRGSGFTGGGSGLVLSIVADINLDGKPEIIAGAAAYDNTGRLLWQNATVGDGYAAVGNFNADPYPEIVVVGSGRVSMLDRNGAILWGPVPIPGGGSGGAPTIADVDGDGIPEIGVAGASRYTVFKADGGVLWSSPTRDLSSSITGSSVFDFDGDGRAEIVYNDELFMRVYKGNTGEVLFQVGNTSGTALELPVIADVDNDGHADIVVGTNDYAFSGNGAGIRVYTDANNSWTPTRKIWNQHSYHITNINDDGTIPRYERNSWQVHNTYRLNAFIDQPRANIIDLSASLLRFADLGGGRLRISVRVGNGGSTASPASSVAFYDGDPSIGGVLLGAAPVGVLQPGQYQDVTLEGAIGISGQNDLYAIVDPDNQLVECRKDNNRVRRPVQTQSSTGHILASTDAPVYGPQSPVQISTTVGNTSTLPAEFNAALRVEDSSGVVLANFGVRPVPTLGGGASAAFSETWNTNGYLAGTYRVRAQLLSVDGGALLDESVATFRIESSTVDPVKVTLRTTTDRPVYNVTDLVNIESLVVNVTTNTLIDDLRLRLRIKDAAGTVLFRNEGPLGQLPPSALRDVLFPYGLSNVSLGIYRVEGEVIDSGTGEVMASSSAQYSVINDLAKSLAGQVAVALPTVEIGTAQLCTYTVTNRADIALTGLALRMTVANVSTGNGVERATQNVDLAASGSQSIVRSVGSGSFTVGDYACVLEALIDGTYRPLGFAAFKVVEPPIRIHASMTVGDRGRLLVLLDTNDQCEKDDDDDFTYGHSYGWDNGSCPKDADPHGPQTAPGLAAQRNFLENLLKQAGWSYTITDNADTFTREFHSGGYSAYALFSEQVKLHESVQKELREANFRGDGLVVAGSHDNRNSRLNDALGIKRIGSVAHADSAVIGAGPLGVVGTVSLMAGDRINRIKRTTAQSLATYQLSGSSRSSSYDCRDEDDDGYKEDRDHKYTNDDCHGQPDTYIDAITLNAYGYGKALVAGFDLLAQATKDGDGSIAAQALLAALDVTHPKPLTARLGGVLPIKLTLQNQGIATSANVSVSTPGGTLVADAVGGVVESTGTGQTISWTVSLGVGEEKNLVFYVRLPGTEASVTLHAGVSVVIGGTTRTVAQTDLTLSVTALAPLDDILAQANALGGTLPTYRYALKAAGEDIDRAIKARNLAMATSSLLNATSDLLGIAEPAIVELRRSLDEWLRYNLMLLD